MQGSFYEAWRDSLGIHDFFAPSTIEFLSSIMSSGYTEIREFNILLISFCFFWSI